MRDPKRIKPIMGELSKFWESNPDWRFGQLMVNIIRRHLAYIETRPSINNDPWYPEDDHWLKLLKEINER